MDMGMIVGCSASSPPLGKIRPRIVILITMETIVVDGLVVVRSGRHGAIQVLQGVAGVACMQKEQIQTTPGNTMVRAHSVHHVRMSPCNKIDHDKVHEAYPKEMEWYAKHSWEHKHSWRTQMCCEYDQCNHGAK